MSSFRVAGKIFITVRPEQTHIHIFLSEPDREQALALYPEHTEKLWWGSKVAGLRLALAKAPVKWVKLLVQQAWQYKAPKRLVSKLG